MSMIDRRTKKTLGVLQDRENVTVKQLVEATGSTRQRVNEILNVLQGRKNIRI
jgi:DNA/RNA-binding domain of Phe-tRNA-synthetase-like protein